MLIIDDSISGKRSNNQKWNWVSFDNKSDFNKTNIDYIYFYILLIIMYFIILGSIRYIILISGIIIVPRPTFENEVVDDSDVREVGEWRDPKCMYFPKN